MLLRKAIQSIQLPPLHNATLARSDDFLWRHTERLRTPRETNFRLDASKNRLNEIHISQLTSLVSLSVPLFFFLLVYINILDSNLFQFDLVCDRGSLGFVSTSAIFAGFFIGSICVSTISDKFGRKLPLFVCGFLCCLFNFVSAFSPVFWVFALFRALVGFMIGKCSVSHLFTFVSMISSSPKTINENDVLFSDDTGKLGKRISSAPIRSRT